MKKRLIVLILLCFNLGGFAQQDEEGKIFTDRLNTLSEEISDAREARNYKKIERLYIEILGVYDGLSENGKAIYKSYKASIYYDLACYQSLLGKKREALKSLTVAHESGWSDYNHAMQDTDLDNIRKSKEFSRILAQMREESDFPYILRQSAPYNRNEMRLASHDTGAADSVLRFTYMHPNDSNLVRIRRYFNLDSIAGSGDELSKIKNLLSWVHNTVRHDGSSYNPEIKNSIAMVELCRKEDRGVNCRMLAQILNECYLAMGFKSRYVTCMPKIYVNDCHVINAVYSDTLDKWVWVDPTFNAYVTDENGVMLGLAEVRERLRKDLPLVLNEDANWNNQSKQTKDYYLNYYMTKNLYYLICSLRSEYNAETEQDGKAGPVFVALLPEGFSSSGQYRAADYDTSNDAFFWQSPYHE